MMEMLEQLKLKRFERKLKLLKPQLFSKWHDQIEEEIRNEYEEERNKMDNELFILRRDIKELIQSRDYFKGKYEGIKEAQEHVQDKLLTQVQKESTTKGQLKEQVKQLKDDLESNSTESSVVE